MPNKPRQVKLCLLATLISGAIASIELAAAAELLTLFTTPEERQIINTNRYKTDEPRQPRKEVETSSVAVPSQQRILEEVSREYRISGITLSGDGSHTVWVNSIAYEDGEQMPDKSRLKILSGDDIRVRITTPDGKAYFASSGETLNITYLAPSED